MLDRKVGAVTEVPLSDVVDTLDSDVTTTGTSVDIGVVPASVVAAGVVPASVVSTLVGSVVPVSLFVLANQELNHVSAVVVEISSGSLEMVVAGTSGAAEAAASVTGSPSVGGTVALASSTIDDVATAIVGSGSAVVSGEEATTVSTVVGGSSSVFGDVGPMVVSLSSFFISSCGVVLTEGVDSGKKLRNRINCSGSESLHLLDRKMLIKKASFFHEFLYFLTILPYEMFEFLPLH